MGNDNLKNSRLIALELAQTVDNNKQIDSCFQYSHHPTFENQPLKTKKYVNAYLQ